LTQLVDQPFHERFPECFGRRGKPQKDRGFLQVRGTAIHAREKADR